MTTLKELRAQLSQLEIDYMNNRNRLVSNIEKLKTEENFTNQAINVNTANYIFVNRSSPHEEDRLGSDADTEPYIES
jgi:hypothetical protein